MSSRVRLIVSGLVLALIVALVWLPAPQTRADDSVRIDAPANGDRVIGKIEVRGRATTAIPKPRQLTAAPSSSQLPQWPVKRRSARPADRAFSISSQPFTSATDCTKAQSRWKRWKHSPRVAP